MSTPVAARLRDLLDAGDLELGELGGGATAGRWRSLAGLARRNVSLGRLVEAHVDGVQILREADRTVRPGRLLGVWASEHPRFTVSADVRAGGLVLRGSKAFCSGAGIVDDALVTVATAAGPLLALVPVDGLEPGRIDTSAWQATAMADTCTATVDLDGIELSDEEVIGGPGWYLDRPGFWHGATGPAACWGGAAMGLVDHARTNGASNGHGRAHLGAMIAESWAIEAVLDRAGREIDEAVRADRTEPPGEARARALVVRHLVDERCESIQRHFERGMGPRPLVGDAEVIERHAALTLYRRQCHAERDLEALAETGGPPGDQTTSPRSMSSPA